MLDNQKTRALASNVIDPVAKAVLRIGITPNQVTVFCAIAVSAAVLSTWSSGKFILGLLLILPLSIGDLLDGTMARMSGSSSALGGFLDSVLDRVTDAALVGSLLMWTITSHADFWVNMCGVIALASGGVVPYVRAKAESLNVPCKVGIMERGERALVVGIAALLAGLGVTSAISVAFAVLAFFNSVTVVQRMTVVAQALR
jgi:CDP-diacylglycerol--glycerol-3-phosphate 3-phosphatidyltransferase